MCPGLKGEIPMTIRDIAAKCGVSVTTVSRVINNQPYVREEVRQQVLRVIEEEHFVLHTEAVNLVRPSENTIGVVVRGVENPFFGELVPMLERAVVEAGYSFLLREVGAGADELKEAAELVKSRRLRGVVLLGGRFDYTADDVAALTAPFACCTFTNLNGELDANSFASVCVDDVSTAERTVQYLLEQGHRRVAVLAASARENSVSELRLRGYRKALTAAGISPSAEYELLAGSFHMADAYAAVLSALQGGADFTAIYAISDAMAVAAIKAVRDFGRRVPGDISVIGIDGMEITGYFSPALTTVIQPKEEIARLTVQALVNMIENKSGPRHFLVEPRLRRGESVCPPPKVS